MTGDAGDRLIDLRDHPLQRDFWWGSAAFAAEFGPMNINDILDRICRDFGINADFARPRACRQTTAVIWTGPFCWCTKRTARTSGGLSIIGQLRPPSSASMVTTLLR